MQADGSFPARIRLASEGVAPAEVLMCPDCVSEFSVIEIRPRIYEAQVQHDPECPWLAQLGRDLS